MSTIMEPASVSRSLSPTPKQCLPLLWCISSFADMRKVADAVKQLQDEMPAVHHIRHVALLQRA